MEPLARLWTWTGHSFTPLAISWAVFVRGGLEGTPSSPGVLISRGYWGLLVTLLAAGILLWSSALYARAAKERGFDIVVPPNTTFESNEARNTSISWATLIVFALVVMAGLVLFGARYAESRIYGWDATTPLRTEFLGSRLAAHERGCMNQPCFAVGPRLDSAGKPLSGVNEYVLYVTDGALLVVAVLVLLGLAYTLAIGLRRSRVVRSEL